MDRHSLHPAAVAKCGVNRLITSGPAACTAAVWITAVALGMRSSHGHQGSHLDGVPAEVNVFWPLSGTDIKSARSGPGPQPSLTRPNLPCDPVEDCVLGVGVGDDPHVFERLVLERPH